MLGLMYLNIGLQILQWLVICGDVGLLSHHIEIPLVGIFYEGIKLIVVVRVVMN